MMNLIVDAHNDLAWNMFAFGRDYTRSAADTRRLEADTKTASENGEALIGWPDYQRGRVAVVFSTLYASPMRLRLFESETQVYRTFDEAYKIYLDQLLRYHQLTDTHPDKFRLLGSSSDLKLLLDEWQTPSESGHAVGLVPLMEGAEGIRTPSELGEWFERGLRLIGLAWAGTRYCGGTREPGPLTDDGRALLSAMADFNFFLDLSHMDEPAALEALDFYGGPVVATHGNCRALLPDYPTNRQFTDQVLRGVIERNGVIGVVPFNVFLKSGWKRGTNQRNEVHLTDVIAHIDHICQMAGNSRHVGIGSDFDGGFGVQSVPPEIDTIADLQKIGTLLQERGYSETDVENILSKNWITRLMQELPAS